MLAYVVPSGATVQAQSQEEGLESYGGDFGSRLRLSGDWGGTRDDLAKKGIVLDVDVVTVGQDVLSGGRHSGAQFGGVGDYTLNFDAKKAGLLPGWSVKIHAQNSFGSNVIKQSGAVIAANGIALYPDPNGSTFAVPNFTITRSFSPSFSVYLGKVETLDGDANEFADYDRNKFLNYGLETNLTGLYVPASTLAAGFEVLPWDGASVNAGLFDPDGKETETGLDHPFKNGVLPAIEARTEVRPFGLMGHQLVGFAWSSKTSLSLQQDPANIARLFLRERFPRLNDPGPGLSEIVQRFFPGLLAPVTPLNVKRGAWNFYYNFDQYFWSSSGKPEAGVGVFFRFGVSDGVTNPVKYHYSAGIGGKDVVPGRSNDTFGVGWSRAEFSNDLVPFLRQRLNLGLKREDAVEFYYNFAATNWLNLTADLQVVSPGLKKALNSSGTLEDVHTTVIAGIRTYMRF